MPEIRVVLVEDQALVRNAISSLLDLDSDIQVIKQCVNVNEAVSLLESMAVDVVVTDIEMPGRSGIDLVDILAAQYPLVKKIIVTTFSRVGYIRRALDAGVDGFVLKDSPSDYLIETIKRVMAGERVIEPELALAALDSNDPLTAKERQALILVRGGLRVADIAIELSLTEGTVRNYLSSAISKLHAGSSVNAARIAHQKGWL